MSDDLTQLRLDVARALKYEWVPVTEGSKCEFLRKGERTILYRVGQDGEPSVNKEQDWTTNLGACQEVLDAIEERGWEWELSCGKRRNGGKRYFMEIDKTEYGDGRITVRPISEAEATGRAEAICRAFCRAVENA